MIFLQKLSCESSHPPCSVQIQVRNFSSSTIVTQPALSSQMKAFDTREVFLLDHHCPFRYSTTPSTSRKNCTHLSKTFVLIFSLTKMLGTTQDVSQLVHNSFVKMFCELKDSARLHLLSNHPCQQPSMTINSTFFPSTSFSPGPLPSLLTLSANSSCSLTTISTPATTINTLPGI